MIYAKLVEGTLKKTSPDLDAMHIAVGLCEEAGEVGGLIKKHIMQGRPLDYVKLTNELGDLRYYLEAAIQYFGVTMEDIEAANIAKLTARYPGGYSDKAAANRADES